MNTGPLQGEALYTEKSALRPCSIEKIFENSKECRWPGSGKPAAALPIYALPGLLPARRRRASFGSACKGRYTSTRSCARNTVSNGFFLP